MIVKNEEAVLDRCLNSVKEIADEIIIVDTGSTDNTKEIASQFTDKIFDFTWCNDFSIARNESLKYAEGKWILVLDADEYLSANQQIDWKKFLNTETPNKNYAYSLKVINHTGGPNKGITTAPVTRLFPNYMGIRFANPIHEQLISDTTGQLLNKGVGLHIEHTGYQEQVMKVKNKHKRNMDIFMEMYSKGTMSAYDYFTLGNQYVFAEEEQKAMECYETAIKNVPEQAVWYPYCLLGLISLYMKIDKLELSWELIQKEFVQFENYPEFHSMQGIHYETFGFYEKAEISYKKAIIRAEKNASGSKDGWLINPDFGLQIPATQLMSLLFKMNRNKEAIHWLSKLLQINKKDATIAIKLLEWLCQNDNSDAIIDFLNSNYDLNDQSDIIFLLKISTALGNKKLVDNYRQLIHDSINFIPSDLMRIALIDDDSTEWIKQVHLIEEKEINNELNTWLQVAIGSVLWKNTEILNTYSSNFKEVNKLIIQFIDGQKLDVQLLSKNSNELFLIAKSLFLLQKYDQFDDLIIAFDHPDIINLLANYFYNINMIEAAMKYYSILLSRQQLNVLSYENLGFYHLNHEIYQEAYEFLTKALEIDPKKRHLYNPIVRSTTNKKNKLKYSVKFFNEFPQFKNISFIEDTFEIGEVE
ncbi:glycosyltransferase [Paenibacillus graminis]|uniref:glycosyltransferase n=1 Tax=Paenibacillus graminis TaxID=189425 RepID=UPI002DBB7FB0|nr:glycosyltransferase [Paenibacillus graminis]MEC0171900.1 glycosyltransferase [Paenibacillus graminis]